MKMKIDFVTNSSTTSFVLIGVKVYKEDSLDLHTFLDTICKFDEDPKYPGYELYEHVEQVCEKLGNSMTILKDSEDGCPSDCEYVVGRTIAETEDEYFNSKCIGLDTLGDGIRKLLEPIEVLKDKELVLIAATASS